MINKSYQNLYFILSSKNLKLNIFVNSCNLSFFLVIFLHVDHPPGAAVVVVFGANGTGYRMSPPLQLSPRQKQYIPFSVPPSRVDPEKRRHPENRGVQYGFLTLDSV